MPKRPLRRGFGCSWLEANRDSGRGSKLVLTPPSPWPYPGRELPGDVSGFSIDRPANPVVGIFKDAATILLLLGEKAGMREDETN